MNIRYYCSDRRSINAELFRELRLCPIAWNVTATNLGDLILSQFRHRVAFMHQCASFGMAISRIVLSRAKKQMLRIDAIANIAPMANVKARWNRPDEQLIGDSMGTSILTINPEDAVAIATASACPQPAGFCLLDELTEAIFRVTLKMLIRHCGAYSTSYGAGY